MKEFSDKELAFRLRTRPSFVVCDQAAARLDLLAAEVERLTNLNNSLLYDMRRIENDRG